MTSNLFNFLNRDKNTYYQLIYIDDIVLSHISKYNDGMVSIYKADQIRVTQI